MKSRAGVDREGKAKMVSAGGCARRIGKHSRPGAIDGKILVHARLVNSIEPDSLPAGN